MSSVGFKDFYSFIGRLKTFFNDRDFTEILAPPIVECPGIEPHIHPLEVYSTNKQKRSHLFLNTSPEFWMKKMLSENESLKNIFSLNFSFRDEPKSTIHRKQFIMLEWYRTNCDHRKIMQDSIDLIQFLAEDKQFNSPEIITVNDLFKRFLNIEILNFLEVDQIKNLITSKFPDLHVPEEAMEWDDYFFLIFLNKIEPHLKEIPFLVLTEYPFHMSALSKINSNDSRVCDRFEIYLNGIEVANCFHELCDLNEQQKRYSKANEIKKDLYGYEIPKPSVLLNSLDCGLPSSSGIALGVERLYSVLKNEPFFLSNY